MGTALIIGAGLHPVHKHSCVQFLAFACSFGPLLFLFSGIAAFWTLVYSVLQSQHIVLWLIGAIKPLKKKPKMVEVN